jgi:hypothetical protein
MSKSRANAASPETPSLRSAKDLNGQQQGLDQRRMRMWFAQPEAGEDAVDLTIALKRLKESNAQVGAYPVRTKGKASFVQLSGVWIDRAYKDGLTSVKVKYLSDAYFRILEKIPAAKDVFSLGQQLVWVAPSGVVLVIDHTGAETLTDAEIAKLLPAK